MKRLFRLIVLFSLLPVSLIPLTTLAAPSFASNTRIKTITFENGSLTDPTNGADRKSGSVQLETNSPLKGVYSATIPKAGKSYLREDFSSTDELYVSFYLRVTRLPSSETRIAMVAKGDTVLGNISLRSDGRLRLRKGSSKIGSDSPALSVGVLYRVGLHQKKSSGKSAVLEAYVAGGDAVFDNTNKFAASTTLSFTSQANRFMIGATASDPAAIVVDDIILDSGVMPAASEMPAPKPVSFSAPVAYPDGYTPRDVVMGDLNGDGNPDLIAANELGEAVNVLLGNANGTFQNALTYPVAGAPYGIALGDLNRDGRLDAVVLLSYSSSAKVLLGNGNGTFTDGASYPVGARPYEDTIADFNGDGMLDLAVANNASNDVNVLLGNGNGTFQATASYPAGLSPFAVAVGDFNGDGKADLVVANSGDNTVGILLGNGDGTFQPQVTAAAGGVPQAVAVADLNGDGKLDLAVADGSTDTVAVLLGNGNGTFQSLVTYAAGDDPASVAIGDLNGDTIPDLAVANWYGGSTSVFVGKGSGLFQEATTYNLSTIQSHSVLLADLNGDGKRDIVQGNYQGFISVLLNQTP